MRGLVGPVGLVGGSRFGVLRPLFFFLFMHISVLHTFDLFLKVFFGSVLAWCWLGFAFLSLLFSSFLSGWSGRVWVMGRWYIDGWILGFSFEMRSRERKYYDGFSLLLTMCVSCLCAIVALLMRLVW